MAVFTEPFADVMDRHLSHWRPTGDFPRFVVAHPLQNITGEEIERRAQLITHHVLGRLPPR